MGVTVDGGAGDGETVPVGDTSRLRVPMATLTVTDRGAGMTREFVQERLFKPFDSTKGSKGMGIGAYQVREYVQSLGGRVDVASDLGTGTRFTVRIPLSSCTRVGDILREGTVSCQETCPRVPGECPDVTSHFQRLLIVPAAQRLNTPARLFKGKPAARQGRKASGPRA